MLIGLLMTLVLTGCDYVSDVRVIHDRIRDFDVFDSVVLSDDAYVSNHDVEIRGEFRKLSYSESYNYLAYEVSEDHVMVHMNVILEADGEDLVVETVTIRYVNAEEECSIVHTARQNDEVDQDPIDIDVFLDQVNGLSVTEIEWMLIELGYDAVNGR